MNSHFFIELLKTRYVCRSSKFQYNRNFDGKTYNSVLEKTKSFLKDLNKCHSYEVNRWPYNIRPNALLHLGM